MRALNVFNNVDIVFPVKLTESERIESENFQSFREFYTELRKNFDSVGRLHEISGSSCSQLDWPDGIGVYVIRKLNFEDIIYVGMTGKVKRTQEGQVLLEDKKMDLKAGAHDGIHTVLQKREYLKIILNLGQTLA